MINYNIREIKPDEIYLLEDFIYEAIFQKDESSPLSREIINKPDIRVYIEDFGKPDDLCLVAEVDEEVVGAVWTRILCGEVKGYGNIDDETPEFAISLYKEYRNKGIGTALMKNMLKLLKNHGYERTSLAVQKDNYAVKMYEKVGFKITKELDEEYIMVHNLDI
ncbi:MAG: N-acetyltransferase family protein [bacterium]